MPYLTALECCGADIMWFSTLWKQCLLSQLVFKVEANLTLSLWEGRIHFAFAVCPHSLKCMAFLLVIMWLGIDRQNIHFFSMHDLPDASLSGNRVCSWSKFILFWEESLEWLCNEKMGKHSYVIKCCSPPPRSHGMKNLSLGKRYIHLQGVKEPLGMATIIRPLIFGGTTLPGPPVDCGGPA